MVQPVTMGLRIWEPDCDKLVCVAYWWQHARWFDLGFNETPRDAFCWGRLSSLSKILSLWSATHKKSPSKTLGFLDTTVFLANTSDSGANRKPWNSGKRARERYHLSVPKYLSFLSPYFSWDSLSCIPCWPQTYHFAKHDRFPPDSSLHLRGMQAWFTITPNS